MIPLTSDCSEYLAAILHENYSLSKRSFLKIAAFAGLGMAPFLNTCGLFSGGDSNHGQAKKMNNPLKNGSISPAVKPPIDVIVPAKVETATFALG